MHFEDFAEISTTLEQPVHATRGRYNQLIGYVDCYITGEQWIRYSGIATDEYKAHGVPPTAVEVGEPRWFSVAVEVKAKINSFGDLLRQIQKYRSEWGTDDDLPERPTKWVVLSPSVNEPMRKFLADQDVVGIRPGDKFLPWCQANGIRLPSDSLNLLHGQLALPEIGG